MVTFQAFSKLMEKRRITVDDLVERFRGKFDNPRELFERMWQGRYADVVIPYRSVLEFYFKEKRLQDMRKSGGRTREIVKEFGGVFCPPIG